jgi:hypothetical protein
MTHVGKMINAARSYLKGKGHLRYLDVDASIILKHI